jgi:hypothetical protein
VTALADNSNVVAGTENFMFSLFVLSVGELCEDGWMGGWQVKMRLWPYQVFGFMTPFQNVFARSLHSVEKKAIEISIGSGALCVVLIVAVLQGAKVKDLSLGHSFS